MLKLRTNASAAELAVLLTTPARDTKFTSWGYIYSLARSTCPQQYGGLPFPLHFGTGPIRRWCNEPTFQCSNVPMFQRSNVPTFQCSDVPMFRRSNDPIPGQQF